MTREQKKLDAIKKNYENTLKAMEDYYHGELAVTLAERDQSDTFMTEFLDYNIAYIIYFSLQHKFCKWIKNLRPGYTPQKI